MTLLESYVYIMPYLKMHLTMLIVKSKALLKIQELLQNYLLESLKGVNK